MSDFGSETNKITWRHFKTKITSKPHTIRARQACLWTFGKTSSGERFARSFRTRIVRRGGVENGVPATTANFDVCRKPVYPKATISPCVAYTMIYAIIRITYVGCACVCGEKSRRKSNRINVRRACTVATSTLTYIHFLYDNYAHARAHAYTYI